MEAEALKLIEAGRAPNAVQILRQFENANCDRVEKEYRMLNQILPAMIETVGPRYLFLDYPRR